MKAYEKLKFYQNICEIRKLIYKITERFAKTHLRLVSQMRDAIRSAKQNIREGYDKDSVGDFLHSIKISRGSLGEIEGDVDDCYQDKLIYEDEYKKLKQLFAQTNYQMGRYMDSLIKLEREGLWKKRWSLSNQRSGRNLKVTLSNRTGVTKSNLNEVTRGNLEKVTSSNPSKSNLKAGSALIITLLIVMVISSIGLGVGRLTLSEIKQTSRMEESIAAEAVSESGIEHGLLLYRFNHDVQISDQCTSPTNCTVAPTESDGNPVSFDMGSGARYELKIWHRNGNDGTKSVEKVITEGDRPALGQDQTAEYDLHNSGDDPDFPTTLDNLTLAWEYEGGTGSQKQVEIILLDADNEPLAAGKYLSQITETSTNIILTNGTRVRIKPWGGNLEQYTLSTIDSNAKLDKRITIIESTGYFGSTKRKLQVKIDRASGTILGTYDFVLYSGEGAITAP